jgi:hypothetical protein
LAASSGKTLSGSLLYSDKSGEFLISSDAAIIDRDQHTANPFGPCSLNTRMRRGTIALRQGVSTKETTMRKKILTILVSALIAASTMQIAAAAEHHKARKADRASILTSERFRNSNADSRTWAALPHWSRFQGGGGAISAPTGH